MAAIASGTTIEAPRLVMVPETLMTGRRPIVVRMSSDILISNFAGRCVMAICLSDSYAIIM